MNEDVSAIKENEHPEGRKQNQRIHYSFVALATSVFVGIVDAIIAVRRHDIEDALCAAVIFFILGPVIVVYVGRRSTERRRKNGPK
jgi:hypothetical protein